jgi:hypothetical protein
VFIFLTARTPGAFSDVMVKHQKKENAPNNRFELMVSNRSIHSTITGVIVMTLTELYLPS